MRRLSVSPGIKNIIRIMATYKLSDIITVNFTITASGIGKYYDIEILAGTSENPSEVIYTGQVYANTRKVSFNINDAIRSYFNNSDRYHLYFTVNVKDDSTVLTTLNFDCNADQSYDNSIGDITDTTGRYFYVNFTPEEVEKYYGEQICAEIFTDGKTSQLNYFDVTPDPAGFYTIEIDLLDVDSKLTCDNTTQEVYIDFDITTDFKPIDKKILIDKPQLIYRDSAGYVRQLPITGNIQKKMTINKESIDTKFNTYNYKSNYTTEWTVNTGLIDSERSQYVPELINSLDIKFYIDGYKYPVHIDEKSVKYETYDNNGHKVINYSFTVYNSTNKLLVKYN